MCNHTKSQQKRTYKNFLLLCTNYINTFLVKLIQNIVKIYWHIKLNEVKWGQTGTEDPIWSWSLPDIHFSINPNSPNHPEEKLALVHTCNLIIHMTGDGRFMVNILNNDDTFRRNHVITARKRSLRRLCFYRCVSVHGGVCYPSMHCRWYPSMPCSRSLMGGVVSQHALQVSRPTPKEEVEGDLAGGSPGPHPRGKLRGIWSRPTAKGDLVQAHTQGESWGGSGWGGGVCSRVCACSRGVETPRDGYCCGRYASYWNAFLFIFFKTVNKPLYFSLVSKWCHAICTQN